MPYYIFKLKISLWVFYKLSRDLQKDRQKPTHKITYLTTLLNIDTYKEDSASGFYDTACQNLYFFSYLTVTKISDVN